jgi:hypothetical protein
MSRFPSPFHAAFPRFALGAFAVAVGGLFSVSLVTAAPPAGSDGDRVVLTQMSDRVRVEIDGHLFTEYRFQGAPKPCLYPIQDAEGTFYTRHWPMKKVEGEIHDHDWHRSVWFAHGLVNGHDFWREMADNSTGRIVHREILSARSGAVGELNVRNDWIAATNEIICSDTTRYRFERVADGYFLDCEVTLRATHGQVVLGDTEEGSLGVRVNEGIRLMVGKGKDRKRGTGRIVNANQVTDRKAWGQRAPWCDYSGTVGDTQIGVAIFDHPKNPSHPTWWHVRDYGLFAANPFGKHDFEKQADQPHAGDITIPAGGELTLRYRIFFHHGDVQSAHVAQHYADYAAQSAR